MLKENIDFIYWSSAESPSSNDEALNEVFIEESSMGHCEQCGRLTEGHHHRGPKRFCSTSCARRYSVSCSRKMVAFHARSSRGGRHSSANQLASDRKSSYSMPMVSSLFFVDLKITHHPAYPSEITHYSPHPTFKVTHHPAYHTSWNYSSSTSPHSENHSQLCLQHSQNLLLPCLPHSKWLTTLATQLLKSPITHPTPL